MSDLDGSQRSVFVPNSGGRPTSLVIDADTLYWLDTLKGQVEKIGIDGTGYEVMLAGDQVKSFIDFDIYKVEYTLE